MHPNYQPLSARLAAASPIFLEGMGPILSNRPGVTACAFDGERMDVTS
jgi:hypothetical protein